MKKLFCGIFVVLMIVMMAGCGGKSKEDQLKIALLSPVVTYCNSNNLTLISSTAIDVDEIKETGEKDNEFSIEGKFFAQDKYGDRKVFRYEGIAIFGEGWQNDADKIDIPWNKLYIR